MALVPRAGGYTVVWSVGAQDGGTTDGRAVDIGPHGFVGFERTAGDPEASGMQWLHEVMARRARENADVVAPVLAAQSGLVSVDERHRPQTVWNRVPDGGLVHSIQPGEAVISTGGVEVTRGGDLQSYEPAVAAVEADGTPDRALAGALHRRAGRGVYRVVHNVPSLHARFSIGKEAPGFAGSRSTHTDRPRP